MTSPKSGRLVLLTIGALCFLPACSDDVSAPSEPTIPTMTLAQLRSAPEMLDLAQQDYSLETYLWRAEAIPTVCALAASYGTTA